LDNEKRKKIIEQLNKTPCTLDKKHKFTVTKFDGKNFTARCFECYKEDGLTNEITGEIKPPKPTPSKG